MSSINSHIAAIKASGLNHKQVSQVQIVDGPDIGGADWTYPALVIWPDGFLVNKTAEVKNVIWGYSVAVLDRVSKTNAQRVEVASDTAQILLDIISSLDYLYKNSNLSWEVSDTAQWAYDTDLDALGGHILRVSLREQYTRDFCDVPGRDFDFPAVGLSNLSVIDEGFSDTTYQQVLIIDSGGS